MLYAFFLFIILNSSLSLQIYSVGDPTVEVNEFWCGKVGHASASQVAHEIKCQRLRKIYRNIATTTAVVAAVGAVYAIYSIKSLDHHYTLATLNLKDAKNDQASQQDGLDMGVFESVYSWFYKKSCAAATTAKMLIKDVIVSGITATITSGVSAYAKDNVHKLYEEETPSWFVHRQTNIFVWLELLKSMTIPYDQYSSYVSTEIFNQQFLQPKRFVADMDDIVQTLTDQNGSRSFGDRAWKIMFLQHSYREHALYLQRFNGYALRNIQQSLIKRHEASNQFAIQMSNAKEIAQMCQFLSKDMQRVIAFLSIKPEVFDTLIKKLILITNHYLLKMGQVLSMPAEQQQQLSEQGLGLLTITCQYDQLLQQYFMCTHEQHSLISNYKG